MSKLDKVGKRKKTGGRTKGTPNKITLSIKQAVIDTFSSLGAVEHMTIWAREQPSEFYRLAARLIPTELTGAAGGPIKVEHYDERETARRLIFLLQRGAAADEKALAKPAAKAAPKVKKKLPVAA